MKKALTAAALLGIATALAPVARGADQYVALAIYDVADSNTVDVAHGTGLTPSAAQAEAIAGCNAKYSGCQPVGTSATCISVVAGPGVDWVYDTGATQSAAAANATAKAVARGWSSGGAQPITHCVGG